MARANSRETYAQFFIGWIWKATLGKWWSSGDSTESIAAAYNNEEWPGGSAEGSGAAPLLSAEDEFAGTDEF